jgi:predicted TIM-barrel fold metal-dependent hydrolase
VRELAFDDAAQMGRRTFLRWLVGGAVGAAAGCGGEDVPITPEERELLETRTRAELEASGRGPLGPLRFRGYRGLAELPWFELDGDGNLELVAADIPAGIDLHTHLGMALLLAPAPDLHARTPRVAYFLDCDAEPDGCELDLDVYMNLNFTAGMLRGLRWSALRQFTIGDAATKTHTIPNLASELERNGFERAAVLPITFGLPFGDDLSNRWLEALAASPERRRFIPGCSVHPRDSDAVEKLRLYVERGARIVKLHPEMQSFRPDAPDVMRVYAECERLGLPVIFHAGRSGIEPERMRPYALPRHFDEAAGRFPGLPMILGHGGARDLPDAIPIAQRHANVFLGIASLGASAILRLLEAVGPERIVFGSDWPFYPVATSLAKLLLATQDRPEVREPVLRGNALRILAFGNS